MSQKEYIIEQATEMFRQLGIKAVRMDDIAQHLGVSKRTLYELFEDKMNLLKLCMINYYETRHGHINAKIGECRNVLESILTAFDLFLVDGEAEQRMQTNLRRFYPALYEELSAMMQQRNRDRLRAAFQKGIDDGLLDPAIDVDLSVAMLGWSLSGVVGPFPNKRFDAYNWQVFHLTDIPPLHDNGDAPKRCLQTLFW